MTSQFPLNKSGLVEAIARTADISKMSAERVLDAVMDEIANALMRGESVTLAGFGTFKVRQRNARTGRNPRTGAQVAIPSANVPKFVAGKLLRDKLK